MRRHGLDRHIRIIPGGLTEEERATAARALLPDPPTAVTVFNDRCATGVLDVLRHHNRKVPHDISVVGYYNSRRARLTHVDLTTIAQDTTAMSSLAVARAIDRIEGSTVTRRDVVIAPRLAVRGSSGPPPAR